MERLPPSRSFRGRALLPLGGTRRDPESVPPGIARFDPGAWRLPALGAATVAAIACTWIADGVRNADRPIPSPARFAIATPTAGIASITPIERNVLPLPPGKAASHASSLVAFPQPHGGADLMAFWYAGSREGAPDVEIVTSTYDSVTRRWGNAAIVVNRHDLARKLGFAVRRLGNPVAWVDPEGDVHLFVVATGAGGWAASRIVHLESAGRRNQFHPIRVLPLSPWFNTSSLVRAPATPLRDGGALLPLYFEVGTKYPLALRVSAAGVPMSVVRMSQDDEALQPTIVALDELNAIALLRDHGESRRMKLVTTSDGGASWTRTVETAVPNPNSAVVAVRLPDGTLAAVVNPSPHERSALVLKRSVSGRSWEHVTTLASGGENEEFSYPSAVVAGDKLHVTFTSRRTAIEHLVLQLAPTR